MPTGLCEGSTGKEAKRKSEPSSPVYNSRCLERSVPHVQGRGEEGEDRQEGMLLSMKVQPAGLYFWPCPRLPRLHRLTCTISPSPRNCMRLMLQVLDQFLDERKPGRQVQLPASLFRNSSGKLLPWAITITHFPSWLWNSVSSCQKHREL